MMRGYDDIFELPLGRHTLGDQKCCDLILIRRLRRRIVGHKHPPLRSTATLEELPILLSGPMRRRGTRAVQLEERIDIGNSGRSNRLCGHAERHALAKISASERRM